MAQSLIPAYSGVNTADTDATPNTLAMRDPQGSIAFTQMAAQEVKSTGVLTLAGNAKTTTYTASTGETVILANAAGGAFTVTLPAAAGVSGRVYAVVKTDSSGNAVTVKGAGSELINGGNTTSLAAQYNKVLLFCNGTQWYILAP